MPRANNVQLRHLLGGKSPADCAEVISKLRFVSRADHNVANGRTIEEPVERDLRDGLTRLLRNFVEHIDDLVEILVFYDGASFCAPGFNPAFR